jgi:nonribosomal peptide synthetase protein BlmX
VPTLLAEQAVLNPAATAVRHDGLEWSYAESAAQVNRLTRFLSARGIGPGSLVPVLFRPRPEALQAMLAVMQAGGAYVPLDPAYGTRRIEPALAEVQPPLLLTSRDSVEGVPHGWGGEIVAVDELDLESFSPDPVPPAADLTDLAYVIYTSGTTGTPNGVEVPHAGLANYLTWAISRYRVRADSGGALVFTSLAFDLTVTSLFVPLSIGLPVTFKSIDAGDLEPLARALRDGSHRFSFLKMTPSHLRALRRLLTPADLVRAAECFIFGGEQLYAEDLTGFEPYLPHAVAIFNEYGPTETVVGATCYEVVRLPASGPIPIGTPIDHVSTHVCDERLNPVPQGVAGELLIGGLGVARGYYKREELTARKFVELQRDPAERVYRTGDLVRFAADGNLEFVGRRDNQVKLRGHRIELDEIEAALKANEAVADAAVLLEREPDMERLIAFVLPNVSRRETRTGSGRMIRYSVTPSELHAHVAARLPRHMWPSVFVLLDALPINVHGKVDRHELSRLNAAGGHARAEYVMPRTEMEEALAAVIGKVLKVDSIGIDDNYFALGGDSIRSIQIAGEAQLRGIKLSVSDLHRFPTIRTLADYEADRLRAFDDMPRTRPFDLVSAEDRARMPADVNDAYPLNLLQEGMIYHRAFAAKSAVYHAMLSLLLDAPFDLPALRDVIQQLVNRHPLLRTSFDLKTFSIPLQLVHRSVNDPMRYADLRGMSAEGQNAWVAAWIEEEKRRGFEVNEFPLIRFMVHRLGERLLQLTFSYHHEIIDGWSEATMVTELLTHYLSTVAGEPLEMRAPTTSFRDAVLLEQTAVRSEAFRTFWERSLEGASFMRLPRLLSSPHADKGQRAIVKLPFPFSKQASDSIKRLALTLGVPLKSVLLAGHMKVMGLFGGSSDVLTHMVSNGRPESVDATSVIGLFVNSFTFRLRLAPGSWRDLILRTLKEEQSSIPYRRYPMAELKRHQGRESLSETLFFLIEYHVYHALERWTNATLLKYDVYGESTFPFCATFRVNHYTSELDMQIEYDSLQFPRELSDAIAAAYFQVYEAMIASPTDKHHLFALSRPAPAFGPGLAPAPSTALGDRRGAQPAECIHEWFEVQAALTPDAVALVCGQDTSGYGELNARANRLARLLRDRGVGPESRIALVLERSPDLVIGMLAVLKAGACYIPLDPEHRSERVVAILRDAAPYAVLVHERVRDVIPAGIAEVWSFEALAEEAGARSSADLEVPVAAESLAYVIFTSGSTGVPKGVMVPHSSLVSSTAARLSAYEVPPDRFLLLSSQAFDSSVAGIYWTLCTGGTLVLPPADGQVDLNQALNLMSREEITHTLCIPSFYSSLIESARERELESATSVIVAGEECRSELWERHKRDMPAAAFFNEYGPSEATVWSTLWKGDPAVKRSSLPIGQPIANVQAFILDRDRHLAPIGVAGELCVGGANLARGYAGNPAATAERFVPNPFAPAGGARMYATGDLAHLTLSGEIEYLGRLDHQMKVRGFRIEPAEIEATLETHPKVKRAVAVARKNQAGENVVVVYVVPAAQGAVDSATLHAFAIDKLPKYLIPASFLLVEALPLTGTGKVDRRALSAGMSAVERQTGWVAPRTPTEEAIARISSSVLSVERVGAFDDFFALGCESLRAMRILAQIRNAFGVELPIASLDQGPATVAALANEVDAALWVRANQVAAVSDSNLDEFVV